jgi:hypothetical protein
MNIGILGAGNIGATLGRKWAAHGHEIAFGVRDVQAEKVLSLLAKIGAGAAAVSLPDAVAAAEVVLFAIPGRVMAETAASLGQGLAGKVVIDASNHVGQKPMHGLDVLRRAAPGASLFRAFSSLGWENFAEPVVEGVQVDLFYCGNGGPARATMDELIAQIGLRPVYIGGLERAELIDAMTMLWFELALGQGKGRHLAFKMIGG